MPSLSDVMWSSLLFDDFIHRYKLVSLAGKEWEKGAERGKEDGKTRQVWHYSCTTPVTECCWAKSRRQIRFRGKALLSPPPTVTCVERITNHYNHLSSPCGPWNIPLLMKLYCKIAEYKCFALFRSGSCKTLWALSMTSPSSDRPRPWLCKETLWLKKERGKKVKGTLFSTNSPKQSRRIHCWGVL